MDRINIGYTDIKGEKGNLSLPKGGTIVAANVAAFLLAKSYAGFDSVYTDVIETTLQPSATQPTGTASLENDKDTKMTLGFESAEGNIKISLPAIKLNIEGGFLVRWGENRAYVPPVAAVGEVGDDGNSICTTLIAAGVLPTGTVFKYGRIVKKG